MRRSCEALWSTMGSVRCLEVLWGFRGAILLYGVDELLNNEIMLYECVSVSLDDCGCWLG